MRPRVPLVAGVAAARAAAGLSRLVGTGGGTTVPGKLLTRLDPTTLDRLAARLPQGSALISATNGKTTTAAMAAEILSPKVRLAHNRSGANLVSGVASTLLAARDAELGLFEVDEAALPEVSRRVRPRALCLGNLFRDQLDRYGELELVAERWREAVAELGPEATLVVNGDDPQVGDLARERPDALAFGLDDPRHAAPALPHAADSKWCLVCGRPYAYTAAYVGHLGDYRCGNCGHARPPLDVVARGIELEGLDGVGFHLHTPRGDRHVRLRVPGLYNVYNALGAAALALSLAAGLDDVQAGLERFSAAFGRFERIGVGDKTVLVLLVKNPAGANEAVRTLVAGGPPRLAVLALNDAIADGRDVSWIWDVDFEPLLEGLERLVVTGDRAAELALRCKYAGFPESAIEVVGDLDAALDRGLELTPAGGELVVLPTYTAMLALRKIVAERGFVRPYWEAAQRPERRAALPHDGPVEGARGNQEVPPTGERV
ncbi:MAG TPA: MurT ligase domain-containing protein [Gaiellaceae bacterium]|nr:MurT ligase domain-containing protein [Gaiellaceae bacterium]